MREGISSIGVGWVDGGGGGEGATFMTPYIYNRFKK